MLNYDISIISNFSIFVNTCSFLFFSFFRFLNANKRKFKNHQKLCRIARPFRTKNNAHQKIGKILRHSPQLNQNKISQKTKNTPVNTGCSISKMTLGSSHHHASTRPHGASLQAVIFCLQKIYCS